MTHDETPDVKEGLRSLLSDAKDRLIQAEAVAAKVPELRRNIRHLERTLKSMDAEPPRRRSGPTIKESILACIDAAGGTVAFAPGEMLARVHADVGGNPNSVQVEIHRLEKAGTIAVDRDADDRPVRIRRPAPKLAAVATEGHAAYGPGMPDEDRLQG